MTVEALLRELSEALAARDIETALQLCHDDVELVSVMAPAEGGSPYRGHSGMRQWWENTFGTWDHYRLEPRQVVDIEEHHALARCLLGGRGKASGVSLERDICLGIEVRDGLLRWIFTDFHASTVLRALADRLEAAS